ncbi:MAG: hypothetical protein RLZZ361_485 [Cyanobacteriota bacterium]|jgi:hypothetical protein
MTIRKPRNLSILGKQYKAYGSSENYDYWNLNERPLRSSDYQTPNDRRHPIRSFLKRLSSKSRNHPRSEKPKRSFVDKAQIIWKRFARRRNSGKAKN